MVPVQLIEFFAMFQKDSERASELHSVHHLPFLLGWEV